MVRGTITRQPGKTGRHEGTRRAPVRGTSQLQKQPAAKAGRVKPPLKPAGRAKRPAKTVSEKPLAGYDPVAPERVAEILRRLDQAYPGVTCALQHCNAWELLVATILSAQCTDARVKMVTPELFGKYPTVEDFARLKPEELEPDIRSTGFFRNKSKALVGAAKKIVGDYGGKVPAEMEQLLEIPGVARKTANVVLGTWFKKNEGVVVDTHVQRIARRQERAGPDARDPAREVDRLCPPAHLARSQAVHRALAQVRRLSAGEPLPRGGQDLEHGGDSCAGKAVSCWVWSQNPSSAITSTLSAPSPADPLLQMPA